MRYTYITHIRYITYDRDMTKYITKYDKIIHITCIMIFIFKYNTYTYTIHIQYIYTIHLYNRCTPRLCAICSCISNELGYLLAPR